MLIILFPVFSLCDFCPVADQGCETGNNYGDPSDCSKYHHCVGGVLYSLECNLLDCQCGSDFDAYCQPPCPPTTTPCEFHRDLFMPQNDLSVASFSPF